jgi:hypothetical protein
MIEKKNALSLKKKLIFVLLVLPSICFTQEIERKGNFFFNVGPEFRITPTYKLNQFSNEAGFTNPDLQNSGVAINIGADYYIINNLSVGFKTSFRHDLITSQDVLGSVNQGVSNSKKGLLIGYHFNLNYHFQIFKKGDLLVSAGVSLLNRNSEFTLVESIRDNNGQVVGTTSTLTNYAYSANKISVGYGNGRSKFMLGIYITKNSGYFIESTTFTVPFVNYSFDFGKL